MPGQIRIRVNQVVIHGEFDGDLAAFRAALEEELRQAFAEWQFSAAIEQPLEMAHIRAPEVARLPRASGQQLGAEIARSVFRGISASAANAVPAEHPKQGANK